MAFFHQILIFVLGALEAMVPWCHSGAMKHTHTRRCSGYIIAGPGRDWAQYIRPGPEGVQGVFGCVRALSISTLPLNITFGHITSNKLVCFCSGAFLLLG